MVEQVPAYAIVGKPQQMTLRIDDGPGAANGSALPDGADRKEN